MQRTGLIAKAATPAERALDAAVQRAQPRRGSAIGNRAALRQLGRAAQPPLILQSKLEVGAIDDPLEREADAVADRVMRMADPAVAVAPAAAVLSRKCAACEEEGDNKVQRAPAALPVMSRAADWDGQAAPDSVRGALAAPGVALGHSTRAFFEPRFGRDFAGVRVHADAAQSAREVGARAYTVGSDMVFAPSAYAPATDSGRRLIAHELAHVLQQTPSVPARLARPLATAYQAQSGPRELDTGAPLTGALRRQTDSNATGSPPQSWDSSQIRCGIGWHPDFMDPITGDETFCVHTPLNTWLGFQVDKADTPRPQPFEPPNLSAEAVFYPSVGDPDVLMKETSKGEYTQPGAYLQTSFPHGPQTAPGAADLTFFTPDSPGNIEVSLTISDPTSGVVDVCSDEYPVVVGPTPSVPQPSAPTPTDIWIFVPDPANAPNRYETTDGANVPFDALNVTYFNVWHDQMGYYYLNNAQRVDLPNPP